MMKALFFLTCALWSGVDAGLRCGNCQAVAPDPPCFLGQVLINCQDDCASNHNGSVGTCMPDYDCVCSGVQTTQPPCSYPGPLGIMYPGFCHCITNITTVVADIFETLCAKDCYCDHGTTSGYCDFSRHQCICNSPEVPRDLLGFACDNAWNLFTEFQNAVALIPLVGK